MSFSSSWRSKFEDGDDDEENENILTDAQETQWSSRDSILFVIDCSPAMLKASEDGEIPFYTAIKCAMTVQLNKIISSESDLVGIILYGTKSKNSTNFEHIYVLQDLDTPDVNKIQQLESIDDRSISFDDEFGTSNGKYRLGEVFWTASTMFSSSAQKVGSKRLFLFTNEDDPHAEDISLRSASKVRAKDLQDFGIKIELFDIDKPDEKFSRRTFYKDILIDGVDDDDEEDVPQEDTSAKLSELLQRVQRKEVKKRSMFNIPFKLAPGLEIGVKGYNLVLSQSKGLHRNVYTLGEAVREVQSVTTWICADTTQYLTPADMKQYWEFGGVKVVFTKEEVAAMKTFGPPGLALIGFKPKDAVKMHYNINHGMFLYPDEKSYEGSTRAFSSLLKAMAEMNKVAICSFTQRSGYSTRLVALLPQLEVVGSNGQEQPPGFQLIPLPWADDIRQLPIETDYTPSTELIDAAKAIISKLNMKKGFHPDNYENPTLQKHYKVLQATALNQRDMDIDDKTLPKTEQMHSRAGAYVQQFLDVANAAELPEPSLSMSASIASSKRGSQSQSQDGPAKKAKSSQPADAAGLLAEMRAKYDNDELKKATVAALKEFLQSVNEKPAGAKKADLISQVEDYFSK
ncbi:SPOC like C-terminal domain-containing protein [Mortierella sp. GBAus27b]|nr:SPOC like C-terminal domain-containing protein [Mortierella sp. GBAus27b]